jgi:hypothetical protein
MKTPLLVLRHSSFEDHIEEWSAKGDVVTVKGKYPHNYPSKGTATLTAAEALRQFALLTSASEGWFVAEELNWHEWVEQLDLA